MFVRLLSIVCAKFTYRAQLVWSSHGPKAWSGIGHRRSAIANRVRVEVLPPEQDVHSHQVVDGTARPLYMYGGGMRAS